MKFINSIRKLIPNPIDNFLTSCLLKRNRNYKRICNLPIKQSGLSEDGIPYIELNSGLILFGYLPTPSQRIWYKYFLGHETKLLLNEDCVNVAYDIVTRYLGPESIERHIGQGKFYGFNRVETIVEIGAYIGYYAIRAAEIVGEFGQVIAIEAIDENFQLLKRNIETNSLRTFC